MSVRNAARRSSLAYATNRLSKTRAMTTLPPPSPPSASAPPNPGRAKVIGNLRFAIAMVVALLADTVVAPFGEIGDVVVDLIVGVILALILGGFRLELLLAFFVEAIPGVGLFPSWALAVPAIWARTRLLKDAGSPPPAVPPPTERK